MVRAGGSPAFVEGPPAAPLESVASLPRCSGRRLVGPLYDYEKDPAGYLKRSRAELGDIFELIPGHVVLARPEWAQRALAGTNDEFGFMPRSISNRESLLRDNVDLWMAARRRAWHGMAGATIGRAEPLLRERLARALQGRRDIDLEQCQRAVAEAAFPLFLHDIDAGLAAQVITASEAVSPVTRVLSGSRRESRRLLRLRALNEGLIDELTALAAARRAARPNPGGPADVLDLLVRDETSPASDDTAARLLSVTMTNLHQVAGAALAWLLVAAGKYPQALRGAASDRHVAEAFVKETLRLYPPIWMTSRRVLCAARFGEHVLAEGSVVLISTRLLHEDARWWRSDPARFAPQRWFDDRPHAPHAYLPYGSGPRICLGAQLSQALLVQAAALLDTHRSVRVTPADPPARIDTVLPPAKLRATLTLR